MNNLIKHYQLLVIGGGVIGCSIFNATVKSGYSTLLIDKASDVATGASKANSGLVHAGFDAKPGTLKAKFNAEGNKMYPSICKRLGVPLKKIGALVVGNDMAEVKRLLERGKKNNIDGLSILNREELIKLEPNLADQIICGLYAKNAYIVSPYLYSICLAEEAVINGGDILLNNNIVKVSKHNNGYLVQTESQTFTTSKIVNCAGAGFNDVCKILGTTPIDLKFRRGEYYVLDHSEANLVSHTIFPLPSVTGKGVLITPTIDGNILVGPTSIFSDDRTITTSEGLAEIKAKGSSILKDIPFKKVIRTFAGIRSVSGDDFVIKLSPENQDIVYAGGICSPGLSSAPAIAKYITELIGFKYNPNIKTKKIKPYQLIKDLPLASQRAKISKNNKYGKIVCKCENISEGEIIDCLNRPIKVFSTDAVKRRVRVGMGRCQSGFCLDKTIAIIAEHNNIKLEDILKENRGSNIIIENVRNWEDTQIDQL